MELLASLYPDELDILLPPRTPSSSSTALPIVNTAPEVDAFGTYNTPVDCSKKMVTNPKIEALFNPLVGPVHPSQGPLHRKMSTHQLGNVEEHHMSEFDFDNQYNSFNTFGDLKRESEESVYMCKNQSDSRKRLKKDDPKDLENFLGPWAGYEGEADKKEELRLQAEEKKAEALTKAEEEKKAAEKEKEDISKVRVTSVFHGKNEQDYQGRSWMTLKNHDLKPRESDEITNFMPKKWVHSFEGHTMGVQAVRMFPETGHLLLSCSMDSKVKIWDFANQRKCLRTYMAHDQAVRDVQFTRDGKRFYSASYDKNVNLWDTETGQVITTLTNRKTPFCVTIHPRQDNTIICGCSNKKAVEYDVKSGQIVQEYDEHLGTVNSVTFIDDARRIVTTSDDKKIFVWEYGIPVVTKFISDPTMHSVPTMSMHPSGKYLCGQSMNNKIITYETSGKFKYVAQKVFRGHQSSGYAIQANFSPDGRFLMSGDTDGKLWFWDFYKGKNYRTIKAHDGVCIGCVWHPKLPSKVVTCGWDGIIKLWD